MFDAKLKELQTDINKLDAKAHQREADMSSMGTKNAGIAGIFLIRRLC